MGQNGRVFLKVFGGSEETPIVWFSLVALLKGSAITDEDPPLAFLDKRQAAGWFFVEVGARTARTLLAVLTDLGIGHDVITEVPEGYTVQRLPSF
jgi:hypothetical protein